MANGTLVSSTFVMVLDGGLDTDGKQILKKKSFRNIKAGAAHDALYTVASNLAPLQQHPLLSVERDDATTIQN
ncbi:DUF1659 domain-containing protein [Terrilactibacillus sp. S3-3]|nr:DUF1659 domain-containing protein [Terrilactibacillus sp. S3-3]